MKYLCQLSSLFILFSLALQVATSESSLSSYLRIDIIEAVNLHCKLNNEFYCNPYAIVEFKYSEETRTSKQLECTKHPSFDSSFTLEPEFCKDIVYIYFYQYLTPKDNAFLGEAVIDEDLYEKGNIRPGYLGRIEIELEKLAFGIAEEWFMIDAPEDNSRIMFPSCVHLRISWTSTNCAEPGLTGAYQFASNLEKYKITDKIKFEPKNFMPVCKKDFAQVYKNRFSRLNSDTPLKRIREDLSAKEAQKRRCIKDPNEDYAFDHASNLTSIEEALGYKIIKRVTGEDLDYAEFTNEFENEPPAHLQTFKQFFEKECFQNPELTIERINNILRIDAQDLSKLKTTNPFLTIDEKQLDLPLKLAKQRDDSVYGTTLKQFMVVEDVKNLDKMDDESYLKSLNKMVNTIKEMEVENKTDYTIFYNKNKVAMTNEGLVHPKEEKFFRIFALYKWNGGHVGYDDLKKEFMLRRKNFYCYELVKIMPTNIIFQFVEEKCPDNYVCVDPNGIVISSLGKDPRKVFAHELNRNGVDFYANFHTDDNKLSGFKQLENKNENTKIKGPTINEHNKRLSMRFSSLQNKKNNLNTENTNKNKINKNNNSKSNANNAALETTKKTAATPSSPEQELNSDLINFETILKMEDGSIVASKLLPEVSNDSETLWLNKFDRLYFERSKRIKLKKEIIINKIYSHIPILGEILAVANYQIGDPEGAEINESFLEREANLFKKYLLLYNSNLPFVEKAAKVLLNLVLCNTDKNRLKYILNEMLEGLCFGDDRSIKIFEEIMRTIIIDSLVNTNFILFEDLHAKSNLLRTFNKPFCFKTMTKIKFIEKMIMLEVLKEKITYILWNNDTNKKILLKILETENSIPLQLPENKRLFSYGKALGFDNAREINKKFMNELKDVQKAQMENLSNNNFKFKSIESAPEDQKEDTIGVNLEEEITKVIDRLENDLNDKVEEESSKENKIENKSKDNSLRNKLNENSKSKISSKNQHKILNNNENQKDRSKDDKAFLSEEEYVQNLHKIGKGMKFNLTALDEIPKENEFDFESIYKENQSLINKNQNSKVIKQEEKVNTNVRETEILKDISKKIDDLKKILKSKKQQQNIKPTFNKTKINSKQPEDSLVGEILNEDFSKIFSEMKFKELNQELASEELNSEQLSDENDLFNEDSNNFSKLGLHQYNNPQIYEKHDAPGINVLSTNKQPSQKDIMDKVMRDPQMRKILGEATINPKNKIIMPKEIHTTYEVNKKGVKQITINKDNPTKKLILKNLMDQKTFNDLMNQEEEAKKANDDQTGLFNVLKNIQNKKCSCDFLCIEIGTINGPFDALKPKKVAIMTNHKENVQLIIKPVIVVNNTNTYIPISPVIPNKTNPPINFTNLFENEDCDLLTMSGSSISINPNSKNNNNNFNQRFKQLGTSADNYNNNYNDNSQNNLNPQNNFYEIKRKFYRKVEYANEILANDIFKQGLNVIILKREKGYPKVYERTFNTNVDPIESDAMACVIRDAGYDKIIVVTGIGKWMGAITPRLIKEIKQIGGPDLNRLVSVDSEDNASLDHAFILIGRRGLCRYNGVFRVKNYDIGKDLKRFFPDLASDPNDCYFENVIFENQKNKAASESKNNNNSDDNSLENKDSNNNTGKTNNANNKFYHLVDLRLTLNLSNDNRFSYKAPLVTSVSPARGPVSGNQKIQIFGYNFGNSLLDIKEILVRGVICKNIEFVSSNILSCVTGNSHIMGAGPGNVVVKLLCGLTSPINTCNMYEYNTKYPDIPSDTNDNQNSDSNSGKREMIKVVNVNVPPPGILVSHSVPPIIPVRNVIRSVHSFRPPPVLPIFSFKERKENRDENDIEDQKVLKALKEKMQKFDFDGSGKDRGSRGVSKVDNLVTDNFKNIMDYAQTNGFGASKDGFRKKRFKNLVEQLK